MFIQQRFQLILQNDNRIGLLLINDFNVNKELLQEKSRQVIKIKQSIVKQSKTKEMKGEEEDNLLILDEPFYVT